MTEIEPDAKLNLGNIPEMSSGKWKGMIETSSVTVYNREELEDDEPLYSAETITEAIDTKIAKMRHQKKDDCTPQEEQQFQDIVNNLQELKEAINQ